MLERTKAIHTFVVHCLYTPRLVLFCVATE